MARITIELPSSFAFSTSIPVRITDLNYGGHVGNDTILSLIHEARMQFLQSIGYSEKNLAGAGIIMGDVSIVFKNELFYGDVIRARVTVTEISKATFDILYKLEKETNGKIIDVAHAKTGMVCYNYEKRKVNALPEEVRSRFSSLPQPV
jgi:acyl-CoA thioester hydrolase